MTAMKYLLLILVVVAEAICLASGWVPIILRGRPKGGMLGPPREKKPGEVLLQPMIFNLQRRDHFSGSRVYYWNQRYFVNDAFFKPGGPVFLLIGGEASADPLWLLDGAMVEYAKTFNAFCVLLEHRFYGKSQPTNDLSLESLTLLNSKQALADIAAFIDDELRIKFNLTNNKLITFGGGYSGSLSAWFRNKYPQIVDGAVASSAPIYMDLDVGSYLATIMDVMGNTSHPACVKETFTATNTIFEWWGQPDKLEKMFQMFRLCDKIDHGNLIEPSALYSALADNWQLVAQYNGINRTFTGTTLNTTETTINTLCGIMTDSSRGPSIQRYADVSNLILEKFGKKCLDYKYQKLISEMKQESLDSSVAEGARQWIYQSCTEFGWFAGSDRGQVPFGPYFALPFNYSCDQCASLFGQEYFCSLEYATNDINRYYGGYRMQLSNAVFPSGTNDPWYPLMFNGTLPSHAQPVVIHGTAHCADLYPSSQNDSPQLKQARERIANMINTWIS